MIIRKLLVAAAIAAAVLTPTAIAWSATASTPAPVETAAKKAAAGTSYHVQMVPYVAGN